jgi:hypothetical protein
LLEMKQVHQDSDTDYGYQKKTALQIKGYNINHKKVYRLKRSSIFTGKNIKTF